MATSDHDDQLRGPQDDEQLPRPVVATALDKASTAASVTADFLTDLSKRIRQQPIGAVVAAFAVGYLCRKVIR